MNISVLINELCSSLFTDARNTVEVVTGISTKSCIVGVLRRGDTGALQNSGFVIQRIIANAALVVQNTDVRILHQLITVAITRHDDDVVALIICMRGESRNDVVTLITRHLKPLNSHRIKKFPNDSQLLNQDLWRLVPLCLVFRNRFVTESGLGTVEHNSDAVWLVILHQCQQHRGEAIHRVRDLATRIGHVVGQRKESTVCE